MENKIKIETHINSELKTVWQKFTSPNDIIHWNNASSDWHTPKAENDLRTGGSFNFRMEAKDGSFGFDFHGNYTNVIENKLIEYTLGDNRKVRLEFSEKDNGTHIVEYFEPENVNSLELQQKGWQAILDNFKKYVEN